MKRFQMFRDHRPYSGAQLLHNILSEFYIPGVKKMIIQLKKSCPGSLRLNKKCFSAFEDNVLT